MKKFFLSLAILAGIVLFFAFVSMDKSRYNPSPLEENLNMMQKPVGVLLQYITPQHILSRFAGWLAESKQVWLKNALIRYFLSRFNVDLKDAVIEDPYQYESFNAFFTRQLKKSARPQPKDQSLVVSPADGFVSQAGLIKKTSLLQAKGMTFDLQSLLGGASEDALLFQDGHFATFYLSPIDYHRVHMPLQGHLRKTIFIPGQLFSVNQQTTDYVPQLFARNERLVCLFETAQGPMAVILVGAMLVGSIETIWPMPKPSSYIQVETKDLTLARGEELGRFKMGSTVILLFGKNTLKWNDDLQALSIVRMGQEIGTFEKG